MTYEGTSTLHILGNIKEELYIKMKQSKIKMNNVVKSQKIELLGAGAMRTHTDKYNIYLSVRTQLTNKRSKIKMLPNIFCRILLLLNERACFSEIYFCDFFWGGVLIGRDGLTVRLFCHFSKLTFK